MGRALLLGVLLPLLSLGCRADQASAGGCAEGACDAPCPAIARPDGAGGCAPILPVECGAAGLGVPGETSCRTIGVATCGAGFVADGEGGCRATLPSAPCGPGTVALPGETTCRPLSTCDEPMPSGAQVFVDAKAAPGGDGTSGRPFAKLGDAVAGAPSGAAIVLADGEYQETLVIKKPVRIYGRCAAKVTLRGVTAGAPVISISGADVELHRLAITGPSVGVSVLRSAARIEQVWLHDLGASGVLVGGGTASVTALASLLIENVRESGVGLSAGVATIDDTVIRDVSRAVTGDGQGMGLFLTRAGGVSAKATVKHSVIERATHAGAKVYGSALTAEDTLVRDVRPDASGAFGFGVYGDIDATAKPSRVELRRMVIERTTESAVAIFASEAAVEDTTIRDLQPTKKAVGYGVFAGLSGKSTKPATVSLARCLVDGAAQAGLSTSGSSMTVDATIVRNTKEGTTTSRSGWGVDGNDAAGVQAVLVLRDSRIDHNRSMGVSTQGTAATIERCVIRDTLPEAGGQLGLGLMTTTGTTSDPPPEGSLTLRDSLVEKSYAIGVGTVGASATIERCLIRETLGQSTDGRFGDGVLAFVGLTAPVPAFTTLSDSIVTGSKRAGVAAFGATVGLTQSRLQCNEFDLDIENVRNDFGAFQSTIDDGGANRCGCGAAAECRAISSGLEPVVKSDVY